MTIEMTIESFMNEIPKDVAENAFRNTSWEPDERGESFRRSYAEEMMELHDSFMNRLPGDQKANFLIDFFAVKSKYLSLCLAYLSAHSRVASTFVTGPSKFPTASNQKRSDTADRRMREIIDFRDKMRKMLENTYFPKASKVIRSGEACAVDSLEAKLAKLERSHDAMVAANKIIRSGVDVESKLKGLGLSERAIHVLTHPDTEHGVKEGFQTFQLSNSSAEIRRVKQRIEAEKGRAECYAQGSKEYTIGEVRIVENVEANRIQLFFPGKPDEAMRTKLKSRGFRWAPSEGAWQRQLTNAAIADAKQVLG